MRSFIVVVAFMFPVCGCSDTQKDAQQIYAQNLKLPLVEKNSLGMELLLLPPGEFLMGSPDSDEDAFDNEKPRHTVTLTQPLYVGKTEVTQEEWRAVMGTTPWKGKEYVQEGANYPATYVSWDDANLFCRQLGENEGKAYRLLTEAEWEYACRAGTTTKYCFGDDADQLEYHAWFNGTTWDVDETYPHPVAQKRPNDFGLYDMHGNVSEWCGDWYDEDYYAESSRENLPGSAGSSYRTIRGGGWSSHPMDCRSAARNKGKPWGRSHDLGFRVVAVPSVK